MAKAMVKYESAYGKGGQNRQRCACIVNFWGDDVPEGIDGKQYNLEIFMTSGWNLSDLKNTIGVDVRALAVELGFVVPSGDINISSFETG